MSRNSVCYCGSGKKKGMSIIKLEVIRSEYGNLLECFEFDYLGGHDELDAILLNGSIKIFEKGIHISTTLSSYFAFVEWKQISILRISNEKPEQVEIVYDNGCIKLEKIKKEVDINKFKEIISEFCIGLKIEYFHQEKSNVMDTKQ